VLDAAVAYIDLREAYGQLTPEEEAHIERLKEIITLTEDGTIKIKAQTESLYAQFATYTAGKDIVTSATFEMGQAIWGLSRVGDAFTDKLIKDLGLLTEAQKAHLDLLMKEADALFIAAYGAEAFEKALAGITEETEEAIAKQRELLKLLGKLYPKGMTTKELAVAGEMMWAAERGIGEVGGYAPGTVGFMRALGYPGYKEGGVIPEPTLLYGLRSQRPYAIAGESGKEYVTAGLSGGGLTINIIEPHVRNDRDIDLMGERIVARLRQMGVKV